MEKIEDIFVTKDTHNPEHIAHAVFWNSKEDGSGVRPQPFDHISSEQVRNGEWFPVDKSLQVRMFRTCAHAHES